MNNLPPTGVIYARVSSQSDRQDTTRQVEDLKRYANAHGISILNIYEEHISGAKKLEERAILTECLSYCTSNSVDYLLLTEISRLGRSTLQVLRSLEILHNAKVSVYIQNIGLSTLQENGEINPIASIIITLLAEFSAIERAQITDRLSSGRKQYVANGGRLGRRKGSTKSDEQRREEYKEVIQLLKKGYSIRNIAKITGYSTQTIQTIKNDFVRPKEDESKEE